MSDPHIHDSTDPIALVHLADRRASGECWAGRLILFLRAVAALSLAKGLYRWAIICGLGAGPDGFAAQSSSWQTATVFFAVIDLVAAVGLWLGAFWGVVIWLASSVTSIVVHALLPQIYGFQPIIIAVEVALIIAYGYLAFEAAREQSQ